MAVALAVFGVAFTAFSIWLTVRFINRRERWAKWTMATVVGSPILYVASFGPACWLADRKIISRDWTAAIYSPIFAELRFDDVLWSYGDLCCTGPLTMLDLWLRASVKVRILLGDESGSSDYEFVGDSPDD
jgi:hypothetical protein